MTDEPKPGTRAHTIYRDLAVQEFIRTHIRQHGYPPSMSDICDHFELKLKSAQRSVERLVNQGLIEVLPLAKRIIPAERRITRTVGKAAVEEM